MSLRKIWPSSSGRSDVLRPTEVTAGVLPRDYYLTCIETTPPPYISRSAFVSDSLVEHLMRHKKDSALGCKFETGNSPFDSITNMEGAMHTFVTAIVPAAMHGDYVFDQRHKVQVFQLQTSNQQQARDVLVSAMVHPDFEDDNVMLRACALREAPIKGEQWPADEGPLNTKTKQDSRAREAYDERLRLHLVANMVHAQGLPARTSIGESIRSVSQTIAKLNTMISDGKCTVLAFVDCFVSSSSGEVLSCEMLFRTAVEQVRNEFRLLEQICPQGYVYTYDPPSIFAQSLDARLIVRMHIAALAYVSNSMELKRMRGFCFNDYADPEALPLCTSALQNQLHIRVVSKGSLFSTSTRHYEPGTWAEGALLVVHNNSDAFGQNIETESGMSSMDSAIGSYSSAAASLHRQRVDLLSRL
ncbi:hypothetical protein BCR37DRAFT_380417, partial [Protomyces lactucae-debilis]